MEFDQLTEEYIIANADTIEDWSEILKNIDTNDFSVDFFNRFKTEAYENRDALLYNETMTTELAKSIEHILGLKVTYKNGKFDSVDDVPSVYLGDYHRFWHKEGELHRVGGPAIIKHNEEYWYQDGERHREDGPAYILYGIYQEWYLKGKKHRIGGPAMETVSGRKEWYKNGVRHNEDGPALIFISGKKLWYIDGERMSKEEFEQWKKRNS